MFRARTTAVLAAGLLCVGCRETRNLPVEAGDDAIVVVALVSSAGAVTAVRVLADDEPAAPIVVPPDLQVVSWVLGADDLVGADGAPLDAATRAGLRVVTAGVGRDATSEGGEVGACGRCLAPTGSAPQIVFAGDLCLIPRFARTPDGLDATLVEGARQQIRLAWAGDCPCAPHQPRISPPVDLRPVAPQSDPWPTDEFAQGPDGTVAVFSEHHVTRIDPSGTRMERTRAPGDGWCQSGPPALPFEGPVLAAGALRDGGFVAVSFAPSQAGQRRVHLFDDQLRPTQLVTTPSEIVPREIRYLDDTEQLYLLASDRVNTPSIQRCDLNVGLERLSCEAITPDDFLLSELNRPLLTVLDDGALVAAGRPRGLAYGRLDAPPRTGWRYEPLSAYLDANGERFELSRPMVIASSGQRVFLCGSDDRDGFARIITATVTASLVSDARASPDWRVVYVSDTSRSCRSATSIPGATAPGAREGVRFSLGGNAVVDLDPDGRVLTTHESLTDLVDADRPISHLVDGAPGWTLAVDIAGGVLRQRRAAAEPRFEVVYGPTPFELRSTLIVVASEGGFVGFGQSANRQRVAYDEGAGRATVSTQPIAGFNGNDVAIAAAEESTSGAMIVAGYSGTNVWLRRVDPAGQSQPIWLDAVLEQDVRIVDMTEAAPGTIVLIGEKGGLLRLQGETLQPIPIEWDDPFTSTVERRPTVEKCGRRRISDRTDASFDFFRAVDGGNGVAWVVGCEGVVLRVTAVGARPHAERVSLARPTHDLFAPPNGAPALTAVRAFCPDNVIFGASGRNELETSTGRIWEVVPNTVDAPLDDVIIRAYPPNSGGQAGIASLGAGRPVELLGADGHVAAVFSQGREVEGRFSLFLRDDAHRFATAFVAGARSSSGDVVLTASYGRILYGRQCADP